MQRSQVVVYFTRVIILCRLSVNENILGNLPPSFLKHICNTAYDKTKIIMFYIHKDYVFVQKSVY